MCIRDRSMGVHLKLVKDKPKDMILEGIA